MSRSLVFGAAGAAIGYFATGGTAAGARWGFMIGSTIGAATTPGPHSEGPRINDLAFGTSTYGSAIPYLVGTNRVAGSVVWASAKREHSTTEGGGKGGGGPSSTTYSYDMDVLILLSENEIAGVTRVWVDGKLAASSASGGLNAGQLGNLFVQLVIAAGLGSAPQGAHSGPWGRMTVYTGASTQLPDPTYEAAVGTANACAYRGRGSVFIQGLQLPNGNVPNLTFEVTTASGALVVSEYAQSAAYWEAIVYNPILDEIWVSNSNTLMWERYSRAWVLIGTIDYSAYMGIGSGFRALNGDYQPPLYDPVRQLIYVGTFPINGLMVINAASATMVKHMVWPSPSNMYTFEINRHTGNLWGTNSNYPTNPSDQYLDEVDADTGLLLRRITYATTNRGQTRFCFDGNDNVWVANSHTTGLTKITIATGALSFYETGFYELEVTYDPLRNSLWTYRYRPVNGGVANMITVSNSNPCLIHHDAYSGTFFSGDYVRFTSMVGMPGLTGSLARITVIDPTHISVDIDTTAFGTFVSGAINGPSTFLHEFSLNSLSTIRTVGVGVMTFYNTRSVQYNAVLQRIVAVANTSPTAYLINPVSGLVEQVATTQERYPLLSCQAGSEFWGGAGGNLVERIQWAAPVVGISTLAEVVTTLCLRAGMTSGQFDVSGITGITKPVRGFAISTVTSTRGSLETLMGAYFFSAVLSDKLYFVARGGSVAATLPYAALGVGADGSHDPLPLTRRSELELPAQLALTYIDANNDYQADTQYSDRLLTGQTSVSPVQVPMVFNASEAKAITDVLLTDAIGSALKTTIAVSLAYTRLEPTDIVVATDAQGSTFRFRIMQRTEAAGALTLGLELDDPSALVAAGVTSASAGGQTVVVVIHNTALRVLDIPLLRDADDYTGIYVAVRAEGAGTGWNHGYLFESLDNLTYTPVATISSQTVIGTATTALVNWTGGNVFDQTNTVTVSTPNQELSSATAADILNNSALNAALIGTELVQFKTATLVATGVYALSGLLRGRRGTEWATASHAIGERFVLLGNSGMRYLRLDNADLGAVRYYKAASAGQYVADLAPTSITPTGEPLRPLSGVDARADRTTTYTVVTWKRRTRLSTRLVGSLAISAPLGEASESYEVEVWNSSYTTLKRTIAATTGSITYTNAQQVTDFGGGQTTLYLRIYQLSAVVGRGHVFQTTV